jgi:hypothetical protein
MFKEQIKYFKNLNNGYGLIVGEQLGKILLDLGCKEGEGFTISKLLKREKEDR